MRQKSEGRRDEAGRTVKDIRRKTRKRCPSKDKIRIVLAGLPGGTVRLRCPRRRPASAIRSFFNCKPTSRLTLGIVRDPIRITFRVSGA